MAMNPRRQNMRYSSSIDALAFSRFPRYCRLQTTEQIRSFELLRLAFFALKLRKLEQRQALIHGYEEMQEFAFRCNLLRHAIFHQVVTLIALGAREQALQLITACHAGGGPKEIEGV